MVAYDKSSSTLSLDTIIRVFNVRVDLLISTNFLSSSEKNWTSLLLTFESVHEVVKYKVTLAPKIKVRVEFYCSGSLEELHAAYQGHGSF